MPKSTQQFKEETKSIVVSYNEFQKYHLDYKIDVSFNKKQIFDNFNLLINSLHIIKENPKLYLNDPEVFIFGGTPAYRISLKLGPMIEAWQNN